MLGDVSLLGRLGVGAGIIALTAVAVVVPPSMAVGAATSPGAHVVAPDRSPGPRLSPCLQSTQCGGGGSLLPSGGTLGSILLAVPMLGASALALAVLARRVRSRRRGPLPSGVSVLVVRPPRSLSLLV
jgi:hypothetical protein